MVEGTALCASHLQWTGAVSLRMAYDVADAQGLRGQPAPSDE